MDLHRYPYIESSLANYFSVSVGLSEEVAISLLIKHISQSPELKTGLQEELCAAFDDPSVSWSTLLEEYEVCRGLSEDAAVATVRRFLFEPTRVTYKQEDL